MMGEYKRCSGKIGLAAWTHDFDWANGHFVNVEEERGSGTELLEMVGSLLENFCPPLCAWRSGPW
jgi:hypothetical protein